jgi:hypothetical protein
MSVEDGMNTLPSKPMAAFVRYRRARHPTVVHTSVNPMTSPSQVALQAGVNLGIWLPNWTPRP